jgi:hypothetical protein
MYVSLSGLTHFFNYVEAIQAGQPGKADVREAAVHQ